MSAQHTEGRLRAGMNGAMAQDTPQVYLFTDEQFGTLVASLKTAPMSPTAEADARRLAACWNACEGIETPELELMTGDLSISNQIIAIASRKPKGNKTAYRKQRDELLEALKELDEKPEHTNSWLRARAAIVKAEGGAA